MRAARYLLKANRDGRGLFKGCEKVLVAVNVPGQLVYRYIRQLPSLGLGHVKDRYYAKGGYCDFFLLFDGLPVLADNCFPGAGVGFLHLLFYGKGRRGKDFNALFAFHHVSPKIIFPSVKARHKGSVRLLHGDKYRIIKAVIMEF